MLDKVVIRDIDTECGWCVIGILVTALLLTTHDLPIVQELCSEAVVVDLQNILRECFERSGS